DKESYRPGERVQVILRSSTEEGQPEPAWLLVSVVNEHAIAPVPELAEPSLPAHFYLTTEVRRPEDLEQADFLLSNHPGAATALDLFLGTQGWRRFRAASTFAQLGPQDAAAPRSEGAEAARLVRLDNEEQVRRKAEASVAAALA